MSAQELNAAQKQALNDALAMAVNAQDIDMMNSAMDSGANSTLLLFYGIRGQELPWVQTAVAHGADVNAALSGLYAGDSQNYPAFHWLIRNFNEKIGDFLLSKGATIDAKDQGGDSALMRAILECRPTAAQFLVKRGANPLLACDDQKFPLQELESAGNWDNSSRLALTKLMLENLQRAKAGQGPDAPAAPAGDTAAVATRSDIEVNKPLEFKKKPHGGLEL